VDSRLELSHIGGESTLVAPEPASHRAPLADGAAALRSRVSVLEVELRDKTKIIHALKKAHEAQRAREQEIETRWSEQCEARLKTQRSEAEAVMERHLKLVDKLLTDKSDLTRKCESLAEELQGMERRHELKLQEMDEDISRQIARHKQNWQTAEKLRREAWEKEKTREIKEMTIKGLEPEVERLISEHKMERKKHESRTQEMLDQQRAELEAAHQRQVRDMKEQLLADHERAIDRERERGRQRLREESERLDEQLREERRKQTMEIEREKRRCEQDMRDVLSKVQEQISQARQEATDAGSKTVGDMERRIEEMRRRHGGELASLGREKDLEKEEWQKSIVQKLQQEADDRVAAIKKELAEARDAQIEKVVERLGTEHVETQARLEVEGRSQLEALEQKHAKEMRTAGSEKEDLQRRLMAAEAQRDAARQHSAGLSQEAKQERDRYTDHQRTQQTLQLQVTSLEKEVKAAEHRCLTEVAAHKERHDKETKALRTEIEALQSTLMQERRAARDSMEAAQRREGEIVGNLEARVKRTLAKKEDTIAELRQQLTAGDQQIRALENLLEKQREELLVGYACS